MNSKTAKFVESYQNGTFVVRKTDRTAEYSLYRAFNETVIYNKTVDTVYECHKSFNEKEENIYELSPLLVDFLGVKGDNFSSILNSVVSNLHYTKATERTANVTAGIETVGWLGCVDTFGDSNLTIQVNVYFSAEHSHLPYNAAFKNPQIYSIHVHFYNGKFLEDNVCPKCSPKTVNLNIFIFCKNGYLNLTHDVLVMHTINIGQNFNLTFLVFFICNHMQSTFFSRLMLTFCIFLYPLCRRMDISLALISNENRFLFNVFSCPFAATGPDVQVVEHVSFDVVTLDNVDKRLVDGFPRGVFCKNMTKADFPHKLPARFKAHIRYLDSSSKFVDNVEVQCFTKSATY